MKQTQIENLILRVCPFVVALAEKKILTKLLNAKRGQGTKITWCLKAGFARVEQFFFENEFQNMTLLSMYRNQSINFIFQELKLQKIQLDIFP